jgi:hypothetical protein
MFKPYLNKLKCLFGKHEWHTPILASLDTYWLQGGRKCKHCGKFEITEYELSKLFPYAYQRGKDRQKLNRE